MSWLIILIKNLTYTGKDKNQFIDDWGQNNVSDSVRSILINFGLEARHFFTPNVIFGALFRPRLARTENQDRRKLEPGQLKTDIRLKKLKEKEKEKEKREKSTEEWKERRLDVGKNAWLAFLHFDSFWLKSCFWDSS